MLSRYTAVMPQDKGLLHVLIGTELLVELDDFRFKHRFESRSAAIKWLLRWALAQRPVPPAPIDR